MSSSDARKARKAAEAAIADSALVAIKKQEEIWSEYDLEGNAKLRIKPLVMDVRKSNKRDADNNYFMPIRLTPNNARERL